MAMTASRPAAATDRRGRLRMPPAVRKAVLTPHVIVSVGWLGLDLGLLTLGITGLVTGVVLGLGTPWGRTPYGLRKVKGDRR